MWQPPAYPDARPRGGDRSLTLILVAVVTLVFFYYRTRVDTIGVLGGGAGFAPMTGPVVGFLRHNLAALVLVGAVPLAVARWWCGFSFRQLGLGAGRWRRGLVWLAFGLPFAVFAARQSAGDPVMQAVYPLEPTLQPGLANFAAHVAGQLAYYTAWELLFRGVLLVGLEKRMGFAGANVIQTALSTLAHFGRPLTETLAAIPGGLIFGGIARNTRSIWYVVAIHLALGAALDWYLVTR